MTASPPFVNRHRELRFLDQQLDKTQRHGTRLALISGLSGMGKTALVQRFTPDCTGSS